MACSCSVRENQWYKDELRADTTSCSECFVAGDTTCLRTSMDQYAMCMYMYMDINMHYVTENENVTVKLHNGDEAMKGLRKKSQVV